MIDAAKLELPLPRPGLVVRARVLARLAAAKDARVVMLVGPAGSGKTTALGQLARSRTAVAWLTCDETDNEAQQLLRSITAALETVASIDPMVAASLSGPDATALRVLPRLTNSLRAAGTDVLLIVDDCHVVTDQSALDVLVTLADRLPQGSTIVLAGRRAPDLPLARWLAEGALVTMSSEDLALNLAEVTRIAAETGIAVPGRDLEAIVAATEGWAVGVYLALLALSRRGNGRPLPRIGEDATIAAYIETEVLTYLDPEDVEFMTRTSILTSLSGPLCDAVAAMPESSARLDALERRSLLVVPVDAERRWFRYHSLLADALRRRLERRDPGRVSGLHLAAARWLEEHGDLLRAVEHAFEAGDVSTVNRLIGTSFLTVYRQGGEGTLARWLARLGDDVIAADAVLPLVAAWRATLGGDPDQADRWMDFLEHREAQGLGDADSAPVLALLRAVQCRNGVAAALADAETALRGLPPDSPWRSVAMVTSGLVQLMAGDEVAARARFRQVTRPGAGVTGASRMAWAELALDALERRAWGEADDLVRRYRPGAPAAGIGEYQTSLLGLVAEARLAIRTGDPRRARGLLARAQAVRPWLTRAMPHWAIRCLVELARTQLMASDPAGAAASVTQAEAILLERPDVGALRNQVTALRAQLEVQDDPGHGRGSGSLTPAELRILSLLQTHLSLKEIASRFGVAPNTAKTQSMSLYAKLGVASRSDAVDRAVELGLLEPLLPPTLPRTGRPAG